MREVHIISEESDITLENKLRGWINNSTITIDDIKFTTCPLVSNGFTAVLYCAMIIYHKEQTKLGG